MKFSKLAVVFLAIASAAFADEASHRKVASELLDLVSPATLAQSNIVAAAEPMFEAMRQQGAPAPLLVEMRAALVDWVDKEFIWDELKPKMVDLYVKEFTEAELSSIMAFYKTPAGTKALSRLPALFADGLKIGQDYAQSKQASLDARIMKVMAKYDPATAAAMENAEAQRKAAEQQKATASEKK